jgi:hypothetical protein
MMIRPNLPSYAAPLKGHSAGAPSGADEPVGVSPAPSDTAELSGGGASAPSPKLAGLLAASAAEAAELKGKIGEHRPGELILRTRGGFSLAGSEGSVVDDFGARVIGAFDTPGGLHKSVSGEFLHIQLPAGVSVEQAMAAMARDHRVEFAVPNHIYTLPENELRQGATNDPDLSKLWGLHNTGQTGGKDDADVDAPEAWRIHTGRTQAQGAHITAVIDTGIDYNHPDLKANMWVNPGEVPGDGVDNDGNGVVDDVHGYNAFADNGDPLDGQGHGTHCAGTIAAAGNDGQGVVGVNQHANLMAVKIFNDEGSTDAAAIIRGVQYATRMGARITSNSWGGPVPNAGIRQAFADSSALHLVAAGNSGTNNDWFPSFPANYNLDNIVAVAATDHHDGLAEFSQFGARNVDLGAPGVDILSTVPGGKYDVYSGTSMATPHVAGAATLIASHYPEISNEELRRRLLEGADKVDSLAGKTVTGGRLNVHASLTMNLT